MYLRGPLREEDAVSPVIGVILMVAITVILAAVLATFVLGIGTELAGTAPSTTFTADYNPSNETDSFGFYTEMDGTVGGILTVTHTGGDSIPADQLAISGATVEDGGATTGGNWATDTPEDVYESGDDVLAGNSIELAVNEGDDGRIIWTSEDGSQSATLTNWEI